ncbi:response regulator transcription factor [Burkholderia stagnalis]|uniref:response regulator transcription factor n=1 Tax=Burkholderia stagnalis TaxID=1503054 RepID=UPI000F55EFAA|nr:response regulator transcription factor [Burkholderia stagnalis]RQQ22536.1 DNA-binding response regulator [Burkholderia stagnalis]RQQ41357.1 DNA-binding response regulator [Burkholderia stagnalis]RQX86080.1 DNA-binding response regulator [Burkholderia stagnalis]RQY06710.1 DNA-binding response regulator [Burkholderia stagnalis]RQY08789.1 DNA-binding response regulator [Burkholderia stagnalis]
MRIAILEDDPHESFFVSHALKTSGHTCYVFREGVDLKRRLQRETFDMLVLDWYVPGLSGADLMTWVRTHEGGKSLPILFLSIRGDDAGIAHILDSGADDYIAKPVSGSLLRARVEALLRRSYRTRISRPILDFGQFRFDVTERQAYANDKPIGLTQKEFELALLLFQNINRPLSRTYLVDLVWKRVTDLPSRTLDTHISQLRTKLGLRPENGYRVTPIHSYGYRLEQLMQE